MSLDIVGLHKLIDQWAEQQRALEAPPAAPNHSAPMPDAGEPATPEAPARVLPKGKRAVRTKTSGDRVYLLDEEKKTRRHIATMEVLQGLGFEPGDVVEIEDSELFRYQAGLPINSVDAA